MDQHGLRLSEGCGLALAAVVATASGFAPIPSLLALAVLWIVPLGLDVQRRPAERGALGQLVLPAAFPCGVLAALSLLLPAGWIAGCLAIPWLLLCGALLLVEWFDRRSENSGAPLAFLVSRAFVPVGAAWLVASRLGLQPLGFQEPIVSLTAIHFHFAGFAAPTLVGRAGVAFGIGLRRRLAMTLALGCIVIGPPLLAIGFVTSVALKLLAASVVATGLVSLSVVTLISVRELRRTAARWCLSLTSLAALAGMALAVTYAIGEYTTDLWLLIGDMERTHGWIQGVGFAALGLLGWRIELGTDDDQLLPWKPSELRRQRVIAQHRDRALTYRRDQIGGWRRNLGRVVVGAGDDAFQRATEAVLTMQMFPPWTPITAVPPRAEEGGLVLLSSRLLMVHAMMVCRVIEVIDEPHRRGFVYGTLAGHSMRGEERFEVSRESDGTVAFEIESFSRAAHLTAWIALPWIRRMQRRFVRDALAQIEAIVREEDPVSPVPADA